MKYTLRLVKGGASTSAEDIGAGGFSPDQPLFDLLDEARLLEAKDRLFNKKLERAIATSDAWISGDRLAAFNTHEARVLKEAHLPILDRLCEMSDLIATTPAYTRHGIIEKLRYLTTLLDGVEAEIVASAIEDLENQR